MASSVFKNITCTVGATQRDGSIELMAAGMMVYVTPQTVVAPGTELSVGHKVLADYRSDRQQIGDNQGALVLRVRAYGPTKPTSRSCKSCSPGSRRQAFPTRALATRRSIFRSSSTTASRRGPLWAR